ncbi:group XV phospholipase A2-like [Belonocnema kinseyi]|uniref:group XV phospholipase A2-like n=1 Tax=Belonocnema kinseyi TaxID=2817044 RepID=UPI00143D871D|nr:group XV phospholipase A2-like [Belonocnema kinseyi]XP_033208978.1 group XV phospholipase A2-like [Belonocnema kinseyi]XP_033208979.1 group XV phospholipase A2-like [Belonocnema kinseyi]
MRFGAIISVILLFSCVKVTEHYRLKEGSNRSPVVLIPGDGGSQVEARLNKTSAVHYICEKTSSGFFNIWLNLELLVPVVIDCWIDNMKLIYDNVTRRTSNQDGVEIRIPGWGDPFVVEYLDPSKASPGSYFKDIGNMLVTELGYIRNVSLRGAPYDFRKGPSESEEFFVKLKSLIEETYTMNNNEPVTLIAHSMGGPMSLIFLQRQTQKWKDKYISSLISLAAVWGGSVKALKVFAIGDDLGTYVLRQSILKDEQITSPSLGWLLPSKLFWKENEVLVQTEQKNYTLLDLQQFFTDINVPNGWEFRKDNEQFQLNFAAPGTEIHCLHGVEIDTVERLYYKPGTSIDGSPQLIPGDGDGTVNLRSLEGCLHWQGKQKQKIYHKGFPGIDHMNILKNTSILDYIKNVLTRAII